MSRRPLRVLLVEDNPDDAELALLDLRRGGYDVTYDRVDTAPAMRAALEREPWDIVLSDFSMPQFSGTAALAQLRNMGLDIPFIIVSGTVGEESAVGAMRNGASDYVLKGNLARLCPAVDRELRDAGVRAEQRRMQEQLLISDRMASVGTLAAGVAHEINNPLAAIIANLELMSRELDRLAREDPGRARLQDVLDELRDARECAERLRQIVRDLKLFSRSSDEGEYGAVDVKAVLESSLRMAWNEIRHRARLIKHYADVPPVLGNESRLGQVFLNLIVNAAQAIREGDAEHNVLQVKTELDAVSGRIEVEVTDSGSGISAENLSRIFDPFFTTKPAGVGTGLGLPICHRIVAAHGGAIEVRSEVGRGTTARVLLPVFRGVVEPERPAVSVAPPTRRGRVLVVDDEPAITRVVTRTLDRDHDVTALSNASEAFERILAGERFDVILCDLMMPQMTGMDLHEALERAAPDQATRMVFLTGGAFTHEARAFLDTVANQRIEKPFETTLLRALINARIQ